MDMLQKNNERKETPKVRVELRKTGNLPPLTINTSKVRVVITYPDINLPAINLWVLPPAWYFYATQEERTKYYEDILNK